MGVEWPGRREDVLNALDILASATPSAEWPTLTEAVHWLVDDTFWDARDPKEDIGALLVDEHEAAAIRSVVSAVVAVSQRQGPTASDQAWLDDSGWPMVQKLAARAATALRGFGGDAARRREDAAQPHHRSGVGPGRRGGR
ncbi:SCO4402 family protein [Nocardioides sp. GXZ039]|uniref:SCO4402 family protein n=1 Tax=Nocardioides sp. GXZ039 TaxID=3136018 RepID=UPI00404099A3